MASKALASLFRAARADFRLVFRDPLLALMPLAPLLAAAALRLLLPPADAFLREVAGLELLGGYAGLVRACLALFPGALYGMVAGFLILDDRDEGLIAYWQILPLGRGGYLLARLGLLSLAALAAGLACDLVLGLGGGGPGALGAALLGALQTPLFGLFLGARAANKVEGLSQAKALGALALLPLALLSDLPLRALAWPFPQFWAASLLFRAGELPPPFAALALGLLLAALWLVLLWRLLARRIER